MKLTNAHSNRQVIMTADFAQPAKVSIGKVIWGFCAFWGVIILGVLATLASGSLQAAEQPYNPALAAQRQELVGILYRTEVCIDTYAQALASMGQANEATIIEWASKTCGGQLQVFLTQIAKWNDADTGKVIMLVTQRQVRATLGWGK